MTVGPDDYDVFLDSRVSLPCVIDSIPPPTIVWRKDGTDLYIDNENYIQHDHSLEIPAAKVSDSGVYECVAMNIAGNTTRSMMVNVMGKLSKQDTNYKWHITQKRFTHGATANHTCLYSHLAKVSNTGD